MRARLRIWPRATCCATLTEPELTEGQMSVQNAAPSAEVVVRHLRRAAVRSIDDMMAVKLDINLCIAAVASRVLESKAQRVGVV